MEYKNLHKIIFILVYYTYHADGIGCFRCTSMNGNNKECEDTFNNTGGFYVTDCWASRKDRMGMFPATECIKMTVTDENDDGQQFSLVVRDCVVDNGGTNSETEIGRQSHCGWMKVLQYNGERMRGCILSCDLDGCNTGQKLSAVSLWIFILLVVYLILQ
ncbi:uncharacterized protein LOC143071624 [Mytilus galloprovincialis]|uniref:Protein sleepless n=1 Tax=Mytilus galloprovincialis TaxID=29158 RepID=A0A8B6CGI4_MYTGA|nr:Hypothetical predicted protein [Mytilus galloprovincialis]